MFTSRAASPAFSEASSCTLAAEEDYHDANETTIFIRSPAPEPCISRLTIEPEPVDSSVGSTVELTCNVFGQKRSCQETLDKTSKRLQNRNNEYAKKGLSSTLSMFPKIVDLTADEVVNLIEDNEVKAAKRYAEEEARLEELIARSPKYPPRNLTLGLPWAQIDQLGWKGHNLIAGKTLELVKGLNLLKSVRFSERDETTFFRIKSIFQNCATDEVKLRGWLLRQTDQLNGQIDFHRNELYYYFDVDDNDPRSVWEQCVFEVELKDVVKIRKTVYTNELYPAHSNITALRLSRQGQTLSYIHEQEVLVARWKSLSIFQNAQRRMQVQANPAHWPNHMIGRKLEFLRSNECSPGKSVKDEELKVAYRGNTILFGSHKVRGRNVESPNTSRGREKAPTFMVVDDDLNFASTSPVARNRLRRTPPQKINGDETSAAKSHEICRSEKSTPFTQFYTFGDAFCGAGGMTRGAFMANLKIKFGLDFNPQAIATWEKNFPLASSYYMRADQFAMLEDSNQHKVDILHLSPPCQPFSPIHVRAGPDDDRNTATMFAVEPILKRTRPRCATLEETFGLLTIHKAYFNSLIRMFTSQGFSVSWQILDLQNFGVPQTRRRLAIVATCPGEKLPDFVKPTHSKNGIGGLLPFVTPRQVLKNIPHNADNHEIRLSSQGRPKPWNDLDSVPTICTSSSVSHPSGIRYCTPREVASLMTFPTDHVFLGGKDMKSKFGTEIRKQIGNSVPPAFGNTLFRHLIEHLKMVDGEEE